MDGWMEGGREGGREFFLDSLGDSCCQAVQPDPAHPLDGRKHILSVPLPFLTVRSQALGEGVRLAHIVGSLKVRGCRVRGEEEGEKGQQGLDEADAAGLEDEGDDRGRGSDGTGIQRSS